MPVVIVDHKDSAEDIYGTVTHNRARGTHLLEPMKAIVKRLMDEGKTVDEIGKELGLSRERVRQIQEKGLSKLRKDKTFCKLFKTYAE